MPLSANQRGHALEVLQEYLQVPRPSDGKTLSELSAERDNERVELIDGHLKPLVGAFLAGEMRLAEFKPKIDDINRRQEHWRFEGYDGQPFFDNVVNLGHGEAGFVQLMKTAIAAPANEDVARNRIREFASFVRRIGDAYVRAGGKRKNCSRERSVPFFLSYFWQIQDRATWPVFYRMSVHKLEDVDLWRPTEDFAENYIRFKHLYEELAEVFAKASGKPFDLYGVEHVFCFRPFPFEEGAVPRPLTEADWLESTDPTPMLKFLKDKASERKLRLFAVACYRRIWHLVDDKQISRKTLEFAERFAEGLSTRNELHGQAWGKAGSVIEVVQRKAWDAAEGSALSGARTVKGALLRLDAELWKAWENAFNAAWPRYFMSEAVQMADATMPIEWVAKGKAAWHDERKGQCQALRDIFGNPFRPITINPSWLTPTVKALAQKIYDDRAFDQLPLLADSLENAGCAVPEILSHLRGPGVHVKGCWVVDGVLGKE